MRISFVVRTSFGIIEIYATTTNFLGQEYALMVADRRQTVTITLHGIKAPLGGKDKPSNEVNKIQHLGNIVYSYSGVVIPGTFENLDGKVREGNWEEALHIVQTHFGRLAVNVSGSFNLVLAGYDQTPKIASFEISPQGIKYKPLEKIVSANKPIESAKIFIGHVMSPLGTIYAEHVLYEGQYSPKLDFAIDALRGSVREDSDKHRNGISKNVNVALVGPNGVRQFDDYENFPDAWIKDDPLGYKMHKFPKPMVDFREQSKRRILEARTLEEANLIYRVVLSGLKDIVMEFTRYTAVSQTFFTRDWDGDPLKVELLFAGAPRELLSRDDLEARLRMVDEVMEPILQKAVATL